MKPRRIPLRASLHHLAEDFVDGILDALRVASFLELETLEGLAAPRVDRGPPVPEVRTELLPTGALAELTRRQREVFEWALRGSSNDAIARALRISLKTVQTHRAQVNAKLGVRSPAELVRFGAAHGLLRAPHDETAGPSPVFNLAELERRAIAAALRATGGNRHRAAALLGISRSSLYNKMEPGPASPRAAAPVPDSAKKRPRRPKTSPRGSARTSRAIVATALARVNAADSPQLLLPHHSEELPDPHPGIAITDPHALLGTPEPAPSSRSAPQELPAAAAEAARRPGFRTGEELLQSAGGRFVLRRKRSRTPEEH